MSPDLINEFGKALMETSWMMSVAVIFAIIIGIPLGIALFVTSEGMFYENRVLQQVAGTVVNIIRSDPFHHIVGCPYSINKADSWNIDGPDCC